MYLCKAHTSMLLIEPRQMYSAHTSNNTHSTLNTLLSQNHLSADWRDLATAAANDHHTVTLLTMQRKCYSDASWPPVDTFYSHSCLIILPYRTVFEKRHTTRHSSTKLHTSTTMTFSSEYSRKNCTEKTYAYSNTHTHAHTHVLWPFFGTTQVSRYQKGKTTQFFYGPDALRAAKPTVS